MKVFFEIKLAIFNGIRAGELSDCPSPEELIKFIGMPDSKREGKMVWDLQPEVIGGKIVLDRDNRLSAFPL